MGLYKLRNNHRRIFETRRINDRRLIQSPFGSSDWQENIQNHYLVWPKFDRREKHRRGDERRAQERRLQQIFKSRPSDKFSTEILLTYEERIMILSLFQDKQ